MKETDHKKTRKKRTQKPTWIYVCSPMFCTWPSLCDVLLCGRLRALFFRFGTLAKLLSVEVLRMVL